MADFKFRSLQDKEVRKILKNPGRFISTAQSFLAGNNILHKIVDSENRRNIFAV